MTRFSDAFHRGVRRPQAVGDLHRRKRRLGLKRRIAQVFLNQRKRLSRISVTQAAEHEFAVVIGAGQLHRTHVHRRGVLR